jgi:protein-tyrosine kinase
MGRVYNALVKADRLTDDHRPIGRPDPDAAAWQPPGAGPAPTPPPRREASPAPAFDVSNPHHITRSDSAGGTLASEFDGLFALSESTGARRAAEPTSPPAEESFAASRRARVAASPRLPVAAAPLFEEPSQVVDVNRLTVAPFIAAVTGGDALAAERYRTLAVRLATLAARRKIKSLVVTSADRGEGKSTVAANLAWTLARRGERRVLLLDGAPGATSVARLLGVEAARGWLKLGDAPAELSAAMLRIDPNGLYVMTARGANEENNAADGALDAALMSSRFEKLLEQLAARFDLIVIAAPTLGTSVEAQQMAALADGCVLVARAGRTPHERLSEATDLVPQERRLGVVLNECDVAEETGRRGRRSFAGRLFHR